MLLPSIPSTTTAVAAAAAAATAVATGRCVDAAASVTAYACPEYTCRSTAAVTTEFQNQVLLYWNHPPPPSAFPIFFFPFRLSRHSCTSESFENFKSLQKIFVHGLGVGSSSHEPFASYTLEKTFSGRHISTVTDYCSFSISTSNERV